ncbi:erythromycin esterase family protein [uncultured Clostridium sp.]|uniref:erythromycin esterase family protein n=1 Tax=uncultured Clostridium sp. TaxID=59620 RepID=UPI0028E38BBC|nr:erythromycin esterase family protein [uncultured Clostridium sp.]
MKIYKFLVLILAVTTTLFTGCSRNTQVDTSNKETYKYLKSNYQAINLENEDGFSDLSIIDDDLKDKEVFFTGESHGVEANGKLKMKFLKYLKEKTDFKYYLCELPYSDGYFLNKYLAAGDINILKKIYEPLKGTFEWNKDNFNHWKELYKYNQSLPKDKRIQVIGMDIEHQPINALCYMTSILPNEEIPKELSSILNELKQIYQEKNIDGNKLKAYCERLQKDMEEKEEIYINYLREDFSGFKLVNDNILYVFEAYADNKDSMYFNKVRDKRMYENFKKVYEESSKGKYYGQWGLNHVFQKEQLDVKWIAAAMNEEGSPLKDKILSIVYAYEDCKVMKKNNDRTYSVGKMNDNESIKNLFNDLVKKDYSIYKLNGEGSPFNKELMWPFGHGKPVDGVTTDYFQYILVIRNSDATKPLNDEYN